MNKERALKEAIELRMLGRDFRDKGFRQLMFAAYRGARMRVRYARTGVMKNVACNCTACRWGRTI